MNWYEIGWKAKSPGDQAIAYRAWLESKNLPDEPVRREKWMQRYQRPAPPASVTAKTLAEIRGEHNDWK